MGKSASGKDRIYSLLVENKELNLKKLILYTTRPIRAGEEEGVQYYFTDDSRLQAFEAAGKQIEARAYHTVLYFPPAVNISCPYRWHFFP